MKKVFPLLAALFMLAIPVVAQAATIRINTPKVILDLAPGETNSGEIVVENPTENEVKIRMYLEDWVYKPGGTGEKDFFPAGSQPLSASRWISFSPAEDTMKPYGRTTIRYTINMPKEVSGGHFSVLFIETILGATEDEDGVSVLVAGRIGSLFYVEAKGNSTRRGELQSVDIRAGDGNKPVEMEVGFKNTGDVDITLQGKYLIMDAQGKIFGRGDLKNIYTLPGDAATAVTEWVGRLPKGSYTALLTCDLGKGQTLVSEKSFSVE